MRARLHPPRDGFLISLKIRWCPLFGFKDATVSVCARAPRQPDCAPISDRHFYGAPTEDNSVTLLFHKLIMEFFSMEDSHVESKALCNFCYIKLEESSKMVELLPS